MKVKDFIKELKKYPLEAELLVSSDEELNTLFRDVQVSELSDMPKKSVVIWGNSGSEVEDGNN